jgi:hypothetical protein
MLQISLFPPPPHKVSASHTAVLQYVTYFKVMTPANGKGLRIVNLLYFELLQINKTFNLKINLQVVFLESLCRLLR